MSDKLLGTKNTSTRDFSPTHYDCVCPQCGWTKQAEHQIAFQTLQDHLMIHSKEQLVFVLCLATFDLT